MVLINIKRRKLLIYKNIKVFSVALVVRELVDHYNAPLMLLRRNEVPKSVEEYVRTSSINKNIIVGGEKTISNEVVDALNKIEKR